jgi:5-methyltetrahydrofolate--homocysteine methyltransferase
VTELSELTRIVTALVEGEEEQTAEATRQALAAGIPADRILSEGLMVGMNMVGEKFTSGEYFLPELLIAGEAMKAAMAILRPAWKDEGAPSRGRVAIGTVQGDVHDIGKNLVLMMLEGNGWSVFDLGVDVPADRFCSAVKELDVDVLGLSALLTTTLPRMHDVMGALDREGLREGVKVMVGGVAVTQSYAEEIGADGYAVNAVEAVKKAAALFAG